MNRPKLDKTIQVEQFKKFYWLKEELQGFCREVGLSTSGGKIEITNRIADYLSGSKSVSLPSTNPVIVDGPKAIKPRSVADLKIDTLIGTGFKCTQIHREFFKQIAGSSFHFSTAIQKFFRENPTKTFQDAIEFWQNEKKSPNTKKEIDQQFEYNRYFRAFFADPANKGKTRKEAIASWNKRKSLPGSNAYSIEEGF